MESRGCSSSLSNLCFGCTWSPSQWGVADDTWRVGCVPGTSLLHGALSPGAVQASPSSAQPSHMCSAGEGSQNSTITAALTASPATFGDHMGEVEIKRKPEGKSH